MLERAKAAAVDGQSVLQYATRAALAALKHIASPESSDSGWEDAPVGTITRMLRAFKSASSGAPSMRKVAKKKIGSEKPVMEDNGKGTGAQPACRNRDGASSAAAAFGQLPSSENRGGSKRSRDSELAEEERRARKKAKKLRQKQDHKDDPEHVAKEKAKRERKKARLKAAKQARLVAAAQCQAV